MEDPAGHGEPAAAERRRLGLLSVVTPMFNEESMVRDFYARCCSALADVPFELVVVNDGSTDATTQILDELSDSDQRVRVVHLSRNFGHQTAITAGLDHAAGDAVVMIDGDLQDPPELIPEMVAAWRAGSDVVYAVRRRRAGEGWFKLRTAAWFYRVFARLSRIELEQNAGDFRLIDRRALDGLLAMRERSRFLRGMTVWIGFEQSAVFYERESRAAGETKYTLRRMLRFSFDAITSFSHVPLQLATLLGFVFSAAAFIGIPAVIAARVAGLYVPGIASTIAIVLLLGGVQLITLGIIGEYLGRIYDEVKRRPLYLVRARRNLDDGPVVERAERDRIAAW